MIRLAGFLVLAMGLAVLAMLFRRVTGKRGFVIVEMVATISWLGHG